MKLELTAKKIKLFNIVLPANLQGEILGIDKRAAAGNREILASNAGLMMKQCTLTRTVVTDITGKNSSDEDLLGD